MRYVPSRLSSALTLIAAGLAGLAIHAHNPAESRLYPPCIFHALTGYHCPGCGSLRATHQLANGHLLRALDYNPLLVAVAPIFIYYLAAQVVQLLTRRRIAAFNLPVSGIWALTAVILLYWVARNIPFYPFTWLAP